MIQLELIPRDRSRLFEELCSIETLRKGFKLVRKNGGAPGIDGITTKQYGHQLEANLADLSKELTDWKYLPQPVRRVEIPKPNGNGTRLLGVPCIKDRVVQSAIKALLEPLIDPYFSDNSFGFRPGRNQKMAIERARKIVTSGKEYVVDIDLSKFFDRVNHDRLINRLRNFIPDNRVLRLIGMSLRSGVMVDGCVEASTEGTTQGSPLSPLLSNVVLDELDKELERRGFQFCRYADDCNIFLGSKKAADKAMSNITTFIEKKLRLKINHEKSKVALAKSVKFLGFTILAGLITISSASMKMANSKVAELIPRGTHISMEETMDRVNSWYMGWGGYYGVTELPGQLSRIEAHIRRRIRARIVYEHKGINSLRKTWLKRGVSKGSALRSYNNMGIWAISKSFAMHKAYSNRWFLEHLNQKIISNERFLEMKYSIL